MREALWWVALVIGLVPSAVFLRAMLLWAQELVIRVHARLVCRKVGVRYVPGTVAVDDWLRCVLLARIIGDGVVTGPPVKISQYLSTPVGLFPVPWYCLTVRSALSVLANNEYPPHTIRDWETLWEWLAVRQLAE